MIKIQSIHTMTEGTVPSPCSPCTYRDGDVLPVQERLHFWRADPARVKPRLSIELIIRHFSRARKRIPFSLIEFLKERYLLSGVG
jgi:hypothetical protein